MATPDEGSRHDYFGPTEDDFLSEAMTRSYQREDDRWTGASQLRDWLIIFAIGALALRLDVPRVPARARHPLTRQRGRSRWQ